MKVIDNFLPEFETIRAMVAQAKFGDFEFMGSPYCGVGQVTLPVRALIEEAMGFAVNIHASHLRIGTKKTPLTHYIHADNYGAEHGLILHFNKPNCETGTAFWEHKDSGMRRMPNNAPQGLFNWMDSQVKDESLWDMTQMVEAKANRAVIFDSRLFHSRYPKELPIEDGETPRLVFAAFFSKA